MVKVAESGFSREGYAFIGWNTAADGSGEAYQPGDEFTLPPNGATLYAQWEEVEEPIEPIEPIEPDKPEPTKPGKPTPKPSSKKVMPATGDPSAATPLVALVGAGLGALLVGASLRRRRS